MKDSRSIPPWRIALFVLIVASFFWLGGVHYRALLGNTLLKPGTLEFSDAIAPEAEREIFRLMSQISGIVAAGYGLTLISAAAFLRLSPLHLKEHGWLMMSAVLLYLFVPVEVFTMVIDMKMIYQEFFTTAGNDVFRSLFIERMAALAGVPIIALLCYYTIVGLVVFQPLKKPLLQAQ